MNTATTTTAAATAAAAPSGGTTFYPDGIIYFIPYAFGVRAPYDHPADGSPEDLYNQAYGHGSYDTTVRVGSAGLIGGVGLGALVTWLLMRRRGR